jgi:hypothetical protein
MPVHPVRPPCPPVLLQPRWYCPSTRPCPSVLSFPPALSTPVWGTTRYSPTNAKAWLATSSVRKRPTRRKCSTTGRAAGIEAICLARMTSPSVPRIPIPSARADRLAWRSSRITSQCQKTGGPVLPSQKNPALILTVNARTVVLKKKATTQCSVVSLRIVLEVMLTSAVAHAVPMIQE